MTLMRVLAVAAGLSLTGPAAMKAQGLPFHADRQGMTAAIGTARMHLDLVLAQLADAENAIHPALNLKVKIPLQDIDINEEMVWVDQLSLTDTRFSGAVANAPVYRKGLQLGDTISFDRAQVVDWSVLDTSGRMYGHFTTRVILKTLPPEQAAQVQDVLMPTPLPDAWR